MLFFRGHPHDDRDVPIDAGNRRRGVFSNVLRKVLHLDDEGLHVALHWICLMGPNRQTVTRGLSVPGFSHRDGAG
jgi:hypothetical protein